MSSKCTCSSWTPRSGSVGHTTSTRSSEWSARNISTCSTPTTRIISCCHSSIWNGCEAKPYQYFDKKPRSTQSQRADASSATGTWSRRAVFPGRQVKLLKISEKFWKRKWQQRRCVATKSSIRWAATALDRIGWGHTATSRDVRRIRNQTPWIQNIQNTSKSFAIYAAKLMQLRASAVPPNLNRNLEAKIESQKYELQSSERSIDNTGFTDQWHEVNLTSIQGVCVCWWPCCYIVIIHHHEYRNQQSVIYHQLEVTPSRSYKRKNTMPKAASKLAAAPRTRQAIILKTQVAVHNFSIPTTSFTTGKYRSYSDSHWLWRTQKERSRGKYDWQMASTTEFRSWKLSFKNEFSQSSPLPRAAMLRHGEVEDADSIDELITLASFTGRPTPDFENLDFKIATRLRKIFNRRLRETSHRSRRRSSIRDKISYRQRDCFDNPRLLQN